MTTEEKTTEKTTEETTEETTEKIPEEKTIGEMVIEDKVVEEQNKNDRENIIYNYIQHIRNISELNDDEIESVIDDAIEEDEELLDILRKFLEKRGKIREKVVAVEIETRDEDDDDRDEDKKKEEIDDILDAFDDPDYAYPLEDIIQSLEESGHADPGTVVVCAINDNILYVDSIDEDEVVYIALTEKGDTLWEVRNR